MKEIKEIPLDKLEIDPMNIRDDISVDEEFINDIEENGVRQPITVRPYDGKYGIVAGSRRYTASINAGLDSVPCMVKDLNDIEARAESIAENKHRKDIPAYRYNEVINELFEDMNGGASKTERVKKIKEIMGISTTTIFRFLSIGELPSDLQARIKKPPKRSESETKAIEVSSHGSEERVPYRVMVELAKDDDFVDIAKENPERAHEIATYATKKGVEKVDDVLESVKVEPDLEPEEAYRETKVEVSKPIKIEISVGSKMNKAVEQYVADAGLANREEAIKDILKGFLKRKEYL